ncbi:MAG: hypothetical protein BWK79_18645 [Beggiatoa sp. IS2]|nr:MAG: hypothetical protein BWK79_18645 [Beggiatoa sp. IS2]
MKILAFLVLLVSLTIGGCATVESSNTASSVSILPEKCVETTQKSDLMHTCVPYILDLQKKLSKIGYYKWPINGILGDKKGDDNETVIALKGFQASKGLKASGILDEDTRNQLGMPKGLTVSIRNLKVKKAGIIASDEAIECGTSSKKALEVAYEYEILWNFSDFSGEPPSYDFERKIIGNGDKYNFDTKEKIRPNMPKEYKAELLSGTQTSKYDMTATIKSICRETKMGNVKIQTLIEPMKGEFEFVILLQGQKYSTVFTAFPK